jgi:nitrile hydratase
MGGMHGFGPVVREGDEPVFHAAWEGKVRAMMRHTLGAGYYNLDEFRHAIERMPPEDYLRASYYERWLHSVQTLLIDKGVITAEGLASGRPGAAGPDHYASWLNALEMLLVARGVVTLEQVEQRAGEYRTLERDPVF